MTGAGGLLGGYVARELAGKTQVSGLDIASPADATGIGTFTKGSIEDLAAAVAAP